MIILITVYLVTLCVIALHYYLERVELPVSDGMRRAVFWPLYLVRWLAVSFILAIKGE